ncbi:hypothetical protein [Acholeplasma laidlawii]|uniref:Uncharacterized protein n=3 Tax=Acholeplasma laidlawii TaxID=2148 RepID=A0A553IGL5_ACHLA|nr:hypothetical protein [Acholeplasma laidlawii]ABX81982.1 hypothetical membrane-bound protein [Acholeplasma laidlawii PG-8A]NWH12349.1 hypothetical protein [Acholeplasma laidlawii]NWH13735.1 hypothetical protein [Acholeplasma laidlawii]NWH14943.1 hypothetical protein [Acholeplasma laidlawii]OAN20063.1 hypothetical protein A2I99_03425 [Acholeplasma laidlawii]
MIVKDILKIKFSSRRRYALFIFLAACVVCGFTIFDMNVNANDQSMVVFNWIIIGVTGLLALFGVYIAVGATLDISALKKDKLPVINALFTKYNRRGISPKDNKEIVYTGQVFLDLDTNEEKMIIVTNVEINKKYKIMYGKHTNIGVVLQKL